jgi:RHS repeat-associated protein
MKIAAIPLILILVPSGLYAQTDSASNIDGLTPEALEPGSPEGAYTLSGLDTVNLYNGSPNITIPLLKIGGRGEAGYTMVAKYDNHWDAFGFYDAYQCPGPPCWAFNALGWANWDYSYRPATIGVRHMGQGLHPIMNNNNSAVACTNYYDTLTRVLVGLADGTELTLVDSITGGSPKSVPPTCPIQGFDRGTVFVATDGSATTFVADAHVYDSPNGSPMPGDGISGTLYFRDGRQFHFGRTTILGLATIAIDRIRDRNGNQTTFNYNISSPGAQYAFTVTDPVGRVTTVAIGYTYSFTDDPYAGCTSNNPCVGGYDQITYKGAGGQPRTITIYRRPFWYDRMASLQTLTIQPSDQSLFGGYASTSHQPYLWAISKIVLPDNHAYQFRYNQYAEIARLELPTGGRYEFDWENGPGTDTFDVCPANPTGKCPIVRAPSFLQPPGGYDALITVYRRVKERREYVDSGPSWTRRTTYSVAESGTSETVPSDPLNQCGSTTNSNFVSGSCTKVTVKDYDPQAQFSTEAHYFYGAVSKYQSLFPQNGWYSWWLEGKEFRTDVLHPSTGTLLQRHLQTWNLRGTASWWSSTAGPQPALDPRVITKDIVVDNGKMARKVFTYSLDNTNNVVDLLEYDYGDAAGSVGALLRRTHTDFLTNYNNPTGGIYIRDLVSAEKIFNAAGILLSETDYFYDQSPLADAPGILQYATVGTQRGNRTTVKRWRDMDAVWLFTSMTYDIAGNMVTRRNPRGYTKTYAYSDCPGTYAFLSSVTNEATQTTTATHDCSLGSITSIRDPNGFQTRAYYAGVQDGEPADALDRLTKIIRPNGQQTTYRYSSDLTSVTTASDQELAGVDQFNVGDQLLRSVAVSDGLGRTVESRAYTSATSYISTKKDLDALGRTKKAYNPVEVTDGQAYANTNGATYTFDPVGRTVATTYADGATDTFSWTGDIVFHWDPAGKVTKEQRDALDRIVSVTEDPFGQSLVTTYSYDGLDSLISVVQGAQIRNFTYNSLKQLRSTTHPEIGNVVTCGNQVVSECYTYDTQPPNDTLKTKASGGVTTTFTYDALDRVTRKTYSDGTPQVDYTYDATQVGCLSSVTNLVSRTTFSYGPGCLVTGSIQSVGGQNYNFTYGYNFGSELTSQTFPSGRLVSYHYDRAGRADRVGNGPLNGSNSFATNITYSPHGALSSMRIGVTNGGSGWMETWQYNNRLQPTSVSIGSGLLALWFTYCPNAAATCTSNNGNLIRETITRNGTTWTQDFVDGQNNPGYDAMNRLTAAKETWGGASTWLETFGYDRYGNRYLSGYSGLPAPNSETPTAEAWYLSNNRVASWEYNDGRGNLTAIPFMQRTYSYDAENHQTAATVNGVNASYGYDGTGRRIRKTVSGIVTTYIYDAMGRVAAEYSNAGSSGSGTQYRHVDHLGSTRLIVNANGTPMTGGCHDFHPFGQELLSGTNGRDATCFPSTPAPGLQFTGKERDAETGLDSFLARYMSSSQGRFTSPDIAGPNLSNPQTLNKYLYALNNPLRYIDRNGLYEEDVHRDLTNALALASGISQSIAARVAAADQGVDDTSATSPYRNEETRRLYHFTTEERRKDLYAIFQMSGSPEALGVFFHAQQDSFSHAGFGPAVGHLLAGRAPDQTYSNPAKADNMARDTFEKLVGARNRLPGTIYMPLDWKTLDPLVRSFNRARTDKDKQQALQQIREAAQRNIEEQQRRDAERRRTGACAAEFSTCEGR